MVRELPKIKFGAARQKLMENKAAGGLTLPANKKEFTVFNSINIGERRAVVGFGRRRRFLMLAWTEMLPVNSSKPIRSK